MIQGAIRPRDRAKAIGSWSGFGGIAIAIGPFVGGWLIEYASWRWIFLLNLPLAVVTDRRRRKRFVPETSNPDAVRGFDVTGAVLGSLALGGVTFALIEYDSIEQVARLRECGDRRARRRSASSSPRSGCGTR